MSVRYSAVMRGCVVWCGGLPLASQVLAFVRNGSDWSYMPNPMGRTGLFVLTACLAMPSSASKDGAAAWNYEHFQFTFDPEACLSNGAFGILNSVEPD